MTGSSQHPTPRGPTPAASAGPTASKSSTPTSSSSAAAPGELPARNESTTYREKHLLDEMHKVERLERSLEQNKNHHAREKAALRIQFQKRITDETKSLNEEVSILKSELSALRVLSSGTLASAELDHEKRSHRLAEELAESRELLERKENLIFDLTVLAKDRHEQICNLEQELELLHAGAQGSATGVRVENGKEDNEGNDEARDRQSEKESASAALEQMQEESKKIALEQEKLATQLKKVETENAALQTELRQIRSSKDRDARRAEHTFRDREREWATSNERLKKELNKMKEENEVERCKLRSAFKARMDVKMRQIRDLEAELKRATSPSDEGPGPAGGGIVVHTNARGTGGVGGIADGSAATTGAAVGSSGPLSTAGRTQFSTGTVGKFKQQADEISRAMEQLKGEKISLESRLRTALAHCKQQKKQWTKEQEKLELALAERDAALLQKEQQAHDLQTEITQIRNELDAACGGKHANGTSGNANGVPEAGASGGNTRSTREQQLLTENAQLGCWAGELQSTVEGLQRQLSGVTADRDVLASAKDDLLAEKKALALENGELQECRRQLEAVGSRIGATGREMGAQMRREMELVKETCANELLASGERHEKAVAELKARHATELQEARAAAQENLRARGSESAPSSRAEGAFESRLEEKVQKLMLEKAEIAERLMQAGAAFDHSAELESALQQQRKELAEVREVAKEKGGQLETLRGAYETLLIAKQEAVAELDVTRNMDAAARKELEQTRRDIVEQRKALDSQVAPLMEKELALRAMERALSETRARMEELRQQDADDRARYNAVLEERGAAIDAREQRLRERENTILLRALPKDEPDAEQDARNQQQAEARASDLHLIASLEKTVRDREQVIAEQEEAMAQQTAKIAEQEAALEAQRAEYQEYEVTSFQKLAELQQKNKTLEKLQKAHRKRQEESRHVLERILQAYRDAGCLATPVSRKAAVEQETTPSTSTGVQQAGQEQQKNQKTLSRTFTFGRDGGGQQHGPAASTAAVDVHGDSGRAVAEQGQPATDRLGSSLSSSQTPSVTIEPDLIEAISNLLNSSWLANIPSSCGAMTSTTAESSKSTDGGVVPGGATTESKHSDMSSRADVAGNSAVVIVSTGGANAKVAAEVNASSTTAPVSTSSACPSAGAAVAGQATSGAEEPRSVAALRERVADLQQALQEALETVAKSPGKQDRIVVAPTLTKVATLGTVDVNPGKAGLSTTRTEYTRIIPAPSPSDAATGPPTAGASVKSQTRDKRTAVSLPQEQEAEPALARLAGSSSHASRARAGSASAVSLPLRVVPPTASFFQSRIGIGGLGSSGGCGWMPSSSKSGSRSVEVRTVPDPRGGAGGPGRGSSQTAQPDGEVLVQPTVFPPAAAPISSAADGVPTHDVLDDESGPGAALTQCGSDGHGAGLAALARMHQMNISASSSCSIESLFEARLPLRPHSARSVGPFARSRGGTSIDSIAGGEQGSLSARSTPARTRVRKTIRSTFPVASVPVAVPIRPISPAWPRARSETPPGLYWAPPGTRNLMRASATRSRSPGTGGDVHNSYSSSATASAVVEMDGDERSALTREQEAVGGGEEPSQNLVNPDAGAGAAGGPGVASTSSSRTSSKSFVPPKAPTPTTRSCVNNPFRNNNNPANCNYAKGAKQVDQQQEHDENENSASSATSASVVVVMERSASNESYAELARAQSAASGRTPIFPADMVAADGLGLGKGEAAASISRQTNDAGGTLK